MEFDKTVVTFFALFLTVYFLESIGGFYMTRLDFGYDLKNPIKK